MATHPDKAHITARQEKYRQALNNCSINEMMSFFSENVHFSDFGSGQVNLTKPQLHVYLTNMIESCDNLNMTTVSINGDKSCTSWEWNITFNYVKKMEEIANDNELGNLEVGGGLLKMVGVSVTW